MKTRRRLVMFIGAGVFGVPLVAFGQQPTKVWRIGWLSPGSPSTYREMLDGFQQGMRDAGYAEGSNVVIEYRWVEGKLDQLVQLAAGLVRADRVIE